MVSNLTIRRLLAAWLLKGVPEALNDEDFVREHPALAQILGAVTVSKDLNDGITPTLDVDGNGTNESVAIILTYQSWVCDVTRKETE